MSKWQNEKKNIVKIQILQFTLGIYSVEIRTLLLILKIIQFSN